MVKRKKKMRIGMAGRNVTYYGTYNVNWGTTGSAYNKNVRAFKNRKRAISFKNKLIKKFKPKYKVDYIYMAD